MAATAFAVICRFPILLFSMLFHYLKLASSNLKWVLEFLLHHPFYSLRVHHHHHHHHHLHQLVITEEDRVEIWRQGEGEGEVDCAVCLSKIGEGDEVRELRCQHVFHRRCLDQWVALRNFTCPLCRDFLLGSAIRPSVNGEGGRTHVLFFKFSSFSDSNSERDNWWLR